MLKACAFDLGNTLINDTELQRKSITALADRLLKEKVLKSKDDFISVYNKINKQTRTPFVSHTFGETLFFEKTFAELKINSISIDEVLKKYREISTELMKIEPEVKSALTVLKNQGKKIAILSNESTIRVDTFLKRNKMDNFFDTVLVSQSFGAEKPDLRIFHEIMKRLKVNNEEIVMFGDNEIADGACRELGIPFVLVTFFKNSGWGWEKGNKHKADFIIERIDVESISRFLNLYGKE
ncbi:MAG: HAD family hydrolase [Spirochaetes bacterium]|nr:HAD family hydrolase [Spirochaetota bacterium]